MSDFRSPRGFEEALRPPEIVILRGPAAAVYGSDAIAGVVNFILRDDFEGFEISTTYGITDRSDGQNEAISIATGGAEAMSRSSKDRPRTMGMR